MFTTTNFWGRKARETAPCLLQMANQTERSSSSLGRCLFELGFSDSDDRKSFSGGRKAQPCSSIWDEDGSCSESLLCTLVITHGVCWYL